MLKGKLIVIDGTDGSGKTTQAKLLVKRLKKEGYKVKMADFPQYGKKSAALVEEYLNGKYGEAESVGPYRASIFYAADRYAAGFRMKKWIADGNIVVTNRYVTASMGHQGGKIKDAKKRSRFFKWLYDLEFGIFEIPKPDMNLIIHVDAAVAQKLVDNKGKRGYISRGNKDIHEKDLSHLRSAEKVYLEIARTFPGFSLVECTKDGKIMGVDEIGEMVWEKARKILK